MILDTWAVIAVLQNEDSGPVKPKSAANLVRGGIILHARYGDHGERELLDAMPAAPPGPG